MRRKVSVIGAGFVGATLKSGASASLTSTLSISNSSTRSSGFRLEAYLPHMRPG